MRGYQKNFRKWAEVAEKVEAGARPEFVKPGAIYWCHLGLGIGSELVGKGEYYTRPVLVLAKIDERLALVLPFTTKVKHGGHYVEVVVDGRLESAILYQSKIIDVKRLGNFIDEISSIALADVRKKYVRFLRKLFWKEN